MDYNAGGSNVLLISAPNVVQGKSKSEDLGGDVTQNNERKTDKKDKQKKAKKKKKNQKEEDVNAETIWENRLLDSKVKTYDFITHAVILDFEGHIKAAIPTDFVPDSQGI